MVVFLVFIKLFEPNRSPCERFGSKKLNTIHSVEPSFSFTNGCHTIGPIG